ncbi:S8 family serine peptidase, partial [Streptomyces sp. NPDC059466]|uniref:S8 family serine peptidase n=1 Tax=Streptomyces sp. NPDC059466 TaxID=3346843 RepID=UPI0036B66980
GTSAAAAVVSGAGARVQAAHPGLSPAQIKKLLEDTARNAPSGGRDDSRGFGFIDPAAPTQAGGRHKPEDLHAAAYGRKYFGKGPDAPRDDHEAAGWLGPVAGGAGVLLLAAAVLLWRGRGTGLRSTN